MHTFCFHDIIIVGLLVNCSHRDPGIIMWHILKLLSNFKHRFEFPGIKLVHVPTSNVYLTHWGRATHIYVGKLTTIGSDNGLSPGQRQAIIWTIAGILLIGPLGTNFNDILIGIQTFSFKKMHLKMSSAKWRPFVSASVVIHTDSLYSPF